MKKAFTLIELIFVIVIVGIITGIMLRDSKSTKLSEAATQLISHIRYTQHLAMVDDKFDINDNTWFKERWQLMFIKDADRTQGKIAYTIFSDKFSLTGTAHDGKPNTKNNEMAMDPLNNLKFLSGGTQSLYTSDSKANIKMNIGLSYDINSYTLSGGCNNARISFDNLGRPIANSLVTYTSAYKTSTNALPRLIASRCIITLNSLNEGSVQIAIEPETGYAHILP